MVFDAKDANRVGVNHGETQDIDLNRFSNTSKLASAVKSVGRYSIGLLLTLLSLYHLQSPAGVSQTAENVVAY
jgi:hypothetical protein